MKSFAKLLLPVIMLASMFASALAVPTFADNSICNNTNVPEEIRAANGCTGTSELAKAENVVAKIIDSILLVLGIACVVFVVFGGIQYMTSAGDSSKMTKAKHTILYACVGLVICVLAFAITNFVVDTVNKATATP